MTDFAYQSQSQVSITTKDAEEERKRHDTPRKQTGIGMGVNKMRSNVQDTMMEASELDLNTDMDNLDNFTDFTTDFA